MSEIKFYELKCQRCGGQLEQNGEIYRCKSCGKTFKEQVVTDVTEQLRAVLNEQKQEAVANLRQQLWAEMHEDNINSERVRNLARDLKKYLPEDYFANFCEVANSEVENNSKQINAYLYDTPQSALEDYAEVVLDFMIKSLKTENITALAQFIERAFKGKDGEKGEKYNKYTTWLEDEADKIDKGIYDLDLPRDVFLAYSSADMDKVLELCEYLESNDISCFMALRNLRHGRDALHNYDQALKTAIDYCKTVVFVSSTHSRSRSCDAFTKELPYIRQKDLEAAPARFRHAYDKLPAEYMMPRVEYFIEDYCGNVAEEKVREFFHGLEWCRSKEAVAKRVLDYLTTVPEPVEEETEEDIPTVEIPLKENKSVKYCIKCGEKNRQTAKFCSKCKGTEFAATYDEYLASKIKFCALCGTQCDSEANTCDNCGSEMFVPTKKAYEDLKSQMAEEERRQKIREQQEKEAERKRRTEELKKQKEKEKEKEHLRQLREEQDRLRGAEEERQRKILEDFDIQNGVLVKYKGRGGDITIPNCVKKIGDEAFHKCKSLINIVIPDGVIAIGKEAFAFCESLISITIPNTLTSIGKEAFGCCYSLTSINVSSENRKYKSIDGNLYSFDGKTLVLYAHGKTEKYFTIPDGVLTIDFCAFSGCKSITSITIPNGATTIGENAFELCKSLTSITIPNSVTSIGRWAFFGCSLTSITIPNSVTSIGESAFSCCGSLTSITIPNSVMFIGEKAFYVGGSLKTIYCRTKKPLFGLPKGWDKGWLGDCKARVVWGYKGD